MLTVRLGLIVIYFFQYFVKQGLTFSGNVFILEPVLYGHPVLNGRQWGYQERPLNICFTVCISQYKHNPYFYLFIDFFIFFTMPSNLGQHTQCSIHVALMITTVTLCLCSTTLTMKTSESWLAATTVSFPFFYHTHTSVLAGIWIAIIHWKEEMKWQKRNAIQFFINHFFFLLSMHFSLLFNREL